MKKQSVFISHSSHDSHFVKELSRDLELNGINTWTDLGKILPGDGFISRIENGLKMATHVLIIFSPHSIISEWVKEEMYASQILASKENIRLIPILIDGFNPSELPLLLQSRIYINFNSQEDYKNSLEKLLSTFTDKDLPKPPDLPTARIEELNVLSNSKISKYAFEILVTNPTNSPVFINRLTIFSKKFDGIMGAVLPQTITHFLNITSLEITGEGFVNLNGSVTIEDDEWGRTITGKYLHGGGNEWVEISLPVYVELSPGNKGFLRFVINEFPILRKPTGSDNVDLDSHALLDSVNNAPLIYSNLKMDFHRNLLDFLSKQPNNAELVELIYEHIEDGFSGVVLKTDSESDIVGKLNFPFLFTLISLTNAQD